MTDSKELSNDVLARRIRATAKNLKLCRENLRYQQRSLEKYKRRCKDLEKIVSLMEQESAPSFGESVAKVGVLVGFFVAGYAMAVHTLLL
jgi:hypothetical protein